MVFYVILATFLVTFIVIKVTNICHPNLLLVLPNANESNKVWYILHPYIFAMKCSHG
jgi:hypothetical protein